MTSDCKLSSLDRTHVVAHDPASPRASVAWWGSLLGISHGYHQGVHQAELWADRPWGEPASGLIAHLQSSVPVAEGLRSGGGTLGFERLYPCPCTWFPPTSKPAAVHHGLLGVESLRLAILPPTGENHQPPQVEVTGSVTLTTSAKSLCRGMRQLMGVASIVPGLRALLLGRGNRHLRFCLLHCP